MRVFDYTFGIITTHHGLYYQRLKSKKNGAHLNGRRLLHNVNIACLQNIIFDDFSCREHNVCLFYNEYRIINGGHILIRLFRLDGINSHDNITKQTALTANQQQQQ